MRLVQQAHIHMGSVKTVGGSKATSFGILSVLLVPNFIRSNA